MAVPGIGSGALARLVQQSADIKSQLVTLSTQTATGTRGDWYGDLDGQAARAINLKSALNRGEAHQAAIGRALGSTAVAQDVLGQLSSIAESFLKEAGKVSSADGTRVTALAGSARLAVAEVASLLNESYQGSYLFGGADTANPPIPDPANIMNTPMATGIAAAVTSLAPGNGAAVLSATLAAATSTAAGTTPFSDYSQDPARGGAEARTTVLAGDGETVPTGLFASRNAAATTPGSDTGSWSRDLLRGLMTLANLTADKTASKADFDAVMTSVKAGLKTAMTGLGEEAGTLGTAEARLEAARTRSEDQATALKSQLSGVTDVDLASALTAMQDTQTRLQASWQALSMLSGLSLTKFLG